MKERRKKGGRGVRWVTIRNTAFDRNVKHYYIILINRLNSRDMIRR